MRTISACILLIALSIPSPVRSQTESPEWTLQPRLAIGKLLPGAPLEHGEWRSGLDGYTPWGVTEVRYEGTALDLAIRMFPARPGWLALTLGGGVTWFYRSDELSAYAPQPAADGVGKELAPADFMVFPFAAGVQLVFPGTEHADFMLFTGAEGRANFISGDIPVDRQVRLGIAVTAGFAVKVFELGLRYESFSDMRNLGAYLGFRLNPFILAPL